MRNVLNNPWLASKNGHLPFVEMNGQETGELKSILNVLSQKFPKSGEEPKNEDKELDDILDTLYWIYHFYRYNNANCRSLFQKEIGAKSATMVPFMPHTRTVFIVRVDRSFQCKVELFKEAELY
uniref:Uncharacterized protein n=1 Tax=Romanomermis culicivorax TaxID=13658 RepID=A0A915JMC7_ROMCU